MDEYIKREDAISKQKILCDIGFEGWVAAVKTDDLNSIPAADVVEVVRCKDCEHLWCSVVDDHICAMTKRPIGMMFFCGYGIKRTKHF